MTIKILISVLCLLLPARLPSPGIAFADIPGILPEPRLVVQEGHAGGIPDAVFSPDGVTVASGGDDAEIKLWHLSSGRLLRTFVGHRDGISSIAFSPDGRILASGSRDHSIKLWDVVTGRELRTLGGHTDNVASVAFSPDGRTLASAGWDTTAKLWDVSTGRELLTLVGHGDAVTSATFSRSGKWILTGSRDTTVRLWDAASGKQLRTFSGHSEWVTSAALSPDGKVAISGSADQTVKLWDTATGQLIRTLPKHLGEVTSVAFSSDGRTIVSGGDTFRQDGRPNQQGCWEQPLIRLWDTKTGNELRAIGNGSDHWKRMGVYGGVASVAFSSDDKLVLASGRYGGLTVWEVSSGRENREINGGIGSGIDRSVAFSPDGETLLSGSGDSTIKAWDLYSGKGVRSLPGHKNAVNSVAYFPDGHTLLSGSSDGTLKIWDAATGQDLRTIPAAGAVDGVAVSPDGATVAARTFNGGTNRLTFWDASSSKPICTIENRYDWYISAMAFSPDGKSIASGTWDNTLRFWDVATCKELRSFSGHLDKVESVAFSPDGRSVASGGGAKDERIIIWDLRTGQQLRTLVGHRDEIRSIAFSPHGNIIASGSGDGTLKLWDVLTGRELRTLAGRETFPQSISFSPDGKFIACAGGDFLKLWRVSNGALVATLTTFLDGSWVVTDAAGRFDTSDLEAMPSLHWVMDDDPFTPLPLEVFMRDYYEPRLLSRIMNGERFGSIPAIGKRNRVQPEVRISGMESVDGHPELMDVTVDARGVARSYLKGSKPVSTGVRDLRLFRNGQLVGYADGNLASAQAPGFHRTFRIRLPAGGSSLRFTAYAFNDDGVKSSTAEVTYTPPSALLTTNPRAYVISIGVNQYDNAEWNLNYSANDARRISKSVIQQLRAQNRYQDIVPIVLVSDERGNNQATKAKIKAVLDRLAGRDADVKDIANGDRLQHGLPDDLVLISFSGHGVSVDGVFYMLPSDIGSAQKREVSPELLRRAISSDDLTEWLRNIDVGDLAMIIDACQSAASVGDDFKPGPMGAHGLGQLAYEKGMRILAASQADEEAHESSLTRQGLLSYALVNDGLDRGKADFEPIDGKITLAEWLSYGVHRVPVLADEVARGHVEDGGLLVIIAVKPTNLSTTRARRALQQPALFDFTKGRRDPVLASPPETH